MLTGRFRTVPESTVTNIPDATHETPIAWSALPAAPYRSVLITGS